MKPLSYVLLAGLWVEPRSGYDLSGWFDRVARHYWVADHSSIYPVLAALTKAGLVRFMAQKSERGPKRKVYYLTEAGEEVLAIWLREPAAPAEVRDEQLVKALAYDLLPATDAITQIEMARNSYAQRLTEYQQLLSTWEEVVMGTDHPAANKLGPRLTLMRGVQVQRGYIKWCDEAIELIKQASV